MAPQTTQLAILFADISGSTRLYEALGDEAARRKVADCLDTIQDVVKRYGGTVIKTIGDEVMCTFRTADDAATAACDMHETLEEDITEQTAAGPISLSIRVGLHFGPAILENGDVFGDAVNVAARMASLAKAGQIITTEHTWEKLSPVLRASTRIIDYAPIKGKKDTMTIYEVIWQQEDVTRMASGVITTSPLQPARLLLSYHEREVEIGDERSSAILGRSKSADISVDESLASRQHVRIEFRRGKFFIIDQSTNGTYVLSDHKPESFLRREEMPLIGNGKISLGRSFSENPKEVVHFRFET